MITLRFPFLCVTAPVDLCFWHSTIFLLRDGINFFNSTCHPEHKLFVGMLPKNVSEAEVSELFSKYGTIKDLQILRGSQQTSKGTCLGILSFSPCLLPYHLLLTLQVFSTNNLELYFFLVAGCAFLKYDTKEQALAALEAINGKHKMEVCIFFFPSLLFGLNE